MRQTGAPLLPNLTRHFATIEVGFMVWISLFGRMRVYQFFVHGQHNENTISIVTAMKEEWESLHFAGQQFELVHSILQLSCENA